MFLFLVVSMTGTKFVTKGETIRLHCNASGSYLAPQDIDWFHDGNKLLQSHKNHVRIRTRQTLRQLFGVLEIHHSRLSDAGIYVCRSTDLELAHIQVHVLDGMSFLQSDILGPFRKKTKLECITEINETACL